MQKRPGLPGRFFVLLVIASALSGLQHKLDTHRRKQYRPQGNTDADALSKRQANEAGRGSDYGRSSHDRSDPHYWMTSMHIHTRAGTAWEPNPEHTTPKAGEPEIHRAARLGDVRFNLHPVAHGRNFAEGHAGLHHAERTGIHSEENNALGCVRERAQVGFVPCPGVIERVVNKSDGRAKFLSS
jgi:ABC-type nickel/cobalt efflux system permease component RcnA